VECIIQIDAFHLTVQAKGFGGRWFMVIDNADDASVF